MWILIITIGLRLPAYELPQQSWEQCKANRDRTLIEVNTGRIAARCEWRDNV